jgi:hypothetical protein
VGILRSLPLLPGCQYGGAGERAWAACLLLLDSDRVGGWGAVIEGAPLRAPVRHGTSVQALATGGKPAQMGANSTEAGAEQTETTELPESAPSSVLKLTFG